MTDYPLSKTDIINYFDGKIKVILYSEIKNYKSIDQLLAPYGRVIILYYWKKYHGHWICCFFNVNGNVEVFDSFGSWIDDTLKDISEQFRSETDQNYKYLTNLLYNGPYRVEYNDKALQSKKSSTCGRWCIYRLKKNNLTIEEFQDLFKNIKNNDNKIINLTKL